MFNSDQKRLLFLSSMGGVLEFYDFIIYALMANEIAQQFFPTHNSFVSLIATFATFSIGYLVRPLGGFLFGHYGDKLGRKKTFTISILIMATATLLIAFVPPYASIGIAAPIIITLLRIIQGLSIGGEIPGAIAYVSESMPQHKGLACGIVFFALINGIVLGSSIQATISSLTTDEQMLAWGWRIPFLIGGVLGLISYLLRRQMQESPLFTLIQHKVEKFPLYKVFTLTFTNAVGGIFITALGASIISGLFLFTPSYLSKVLHLTETKYLWFNTAALFFSTCLIIPFGRMTDKLKPNHLILCLILLTFVLAYPIYWIFQHEMGFFLAAFCFSALLNGLAWGVIPSLLSKLFPTNIRYSGIAISYNFGFAIFGGLTPLISTLLIYTTQSPTAPAFYLIFVAVLAGVALCFLKTQEL